MFRFTIRDVLLVMVIVGLALGWWVDRSRLLTANREAVTDATNLAKWTSAGRLRAGKQIQLQFVQEKYGGGKIRLAAGEWEKIRVMPPTVSDP